VQTTARTPCDDYIEDRLQGLREFCHCDWNNAPSTPSIGGKAQTPQRCLLYSSHPELLIAEFQNCETLYIFAMSVLPDRPACDSLAGSPLSNWSQRTLGGPYDRRKSLTAHFSTSLVC
jgi:hypothetical protein